MSSDILAVIEAAYRLDVPGPEWLRDLAAATNALVGQGLGLLGFEYQVDPKLRLKVGDAATIGIPEELLGPLRGTLESLPPSYVAKTFACCECTTQSEASDAEIREANRLSMEMMEQMFGVRDILIVGGMDPSGCGVYMGAWLPNATRLPDDVRETWCRVAVHMVAARRLRARLAQHEANVADTADAVLTPDGKVDHAEGEAREDEAREALRSAVGELERARGPLRLSDPGAAVAEWKGLVSARWTLVEHFEADGKRYLVARRNDVRLAGVRLLADRERQVVAHAALGHSNKLIAYELGISDSTVRVLLHRAGKKLEADTREALVAKYLESAASRMDGEE
jgi:DNA-binding CsgD family transcriptional regulator